MPDDDSTTAGRIIGRYVLCSEVAWGGMATVHLGKLLGPAGFARTVAIKRLHPPFAKDPEFVSMFLDEARLAARVRHPNVVAVLDVVARDSELFLVMDYVHGESLARLLRVAQSQQLSVPLSVAAGILAGVLRGLHAAHDARSDRGEPLEIVHRDVSPHNVLVGTDGIASVVDFGVAKATTRFQTTREGQLKGKLSYMAPEQLRLEPIDRRTDVYSASVVLWETLTGQRLFAGDDPGSVMAGVLAGRIVPPSQLRVDLSPELDAVVLRGLSSQPADRYPTARDMAAALENVVPLASPAQIGAWVEELAEETLGQRSELIAEMESGAPSTAPERHRFVAASHGAGRSHAARRTAWDLAGRPRGRRPRSRRRPCPRARAAQGSRLLASEPHRLVRVRRPFTPLGVVGVGAGGGYRADHRRWQFWSSVARGIHLRRPAPCEAYRRPGPIRPGWPPPRPRVRGRRLPPLRPRPRRATGGSRAVPPSRRGVEADQVVA